MPFLDLNLPLTFQMYALCLMDYQLIIVDNAYLVHKPVNQNTQLYEHTIYRYLVDVEKDFVIRNVIRDLDLIHGSYNTSNKGCMF